MVSHRRFMTILAALALATAGGCSDDDAQPPVVTVEVNGPHAVTIGQSGSLQAATLNGTDSGYTWLSSNSRVATVSPEGVVTGVAAGEVEITATGTDSRVTGRHAVVVIPVEGIPVVTVTGSVFLVVGQTSTFDATTANGTDSGYSWASSDEVIATVDPASGAVTAHAKGTVTITATGVDTGASGSLAVRIDSDIPNEAEWLSSGHADINAEAFRHWDGDGEIRSSCARCHSGAGFEDYLGADGTAPWVVDNAAPLGRTVDCNACHNPAASTLSQVTFPSGVTLTGLGPEARCMTCHQGRESGDSVEASIDATMAPDTVYATLSFKNIHYFAAGATLQGSRVRGGYQYSGAVYDWRFRHVPGYDTCVGCHDPHSLEVKVEECAECHTGVTSLDDLKGVRMMASAGNDYDGDGDVTEGLWHELDGLRTKLLLAIQAYAAGTAGSSAICYNAAAYPYWFVDDDGNGTCDAAETTRFSTWTPRLVRATYNFQVATKDTGAFAHNGKYVIQLLHDSIGDLNASALGTLVDLTSAVRNDYGHFDGAGEPARHWDEDDAVSTSCARCHGGAEGFRFFLDYGVGKQELEQGNGLDCATCHEDLRTPDALVAVNAITFPGDVSFDLQIAMGDQVSNLCGTCHAGRESKATIDAYTGTSFRNVHYLPAAAVRAGAGARVGYEYDWQTLGYAPAESHHGGCTTCHKAVLSNHTFSVAATYGSNTGGTLHCAGCHQGTSPADGSFRMGTRTGDYDGDGDNTESLADEVAGIASSVYAAMTAFALSNARPEPCYSSSNYPYWFKKNAAVPLDGNGECGATNGFTSADRYSFANDGPGRSLLAAAHNLQIWHKEPGAWAHNFDYIVQILRDSYEDLDGTPLEGIRP